MYILYRRRDVVSKAMIGGGVGSLPARLSVKLPMKLPAKLPVKLPMKITHRWCQRGWVGFSALIIGLAPGAMARADMQPVTATIEASDDVSFTNLLVRAETEAAGLITSTFAANPAVTAVSVQISADRYGKISPIFAVVVSRGDWQANPSVPAWAQYLPPAAVLLGFRAPTSSAGSAGPLAGHSGNPSNPNNEPNFYQ